MLTLEQQQRYDLEFMTTMLIGSDRLPPTSANWSAGMYDLPALRTRVARLSHDLIANTRAQRRLTTMLRALPTESGNTLPQI